MTPRDELIETAAKSQYKQWGGFTKWECLSDLARERYRRIASDFLHDIEAHAGGCIIVPRQGTREMIDAAAQECRFSLRPGDEAMTKKKLIAEALDHCYKYSGEPWPDYEKVEVEVGFLRQLVAALEAHQWQPIDAARPAMTAEDEDRAWCIMLGAYNLALHVGHLAPMQATLVALREHFDITPKVKP